MNFKQIEKYAKEHNVPIMQKTGIEFLSKYISDNNVKNILEIGSAIGYSAIKMALVNDKVKVTTIEKDDERYLMAIKNIKEFNLEKRITLVHADALDITLEGKYDLIFIDAAKGKNTLFFNKYKDNLNKDGVIITDNLSFHGLVEDSSLIKTKNQRGIVNKIKDYITFLDKNEEFITTYIPLGDTISISKRRCNNE